MMNERSSLVFLSSFFILHALLAVTVPQRSAADYIFTIPALTNHIRGVVVDVDSTNAYRVIRSEDADWIREALAERNAILSGRVSSTSNNVGPIVKRGDVPAAPGFPADSYSWLDGAAPLLDGVRIREELPQTTNIYTQISFTNGYTNAVSYITMPMTNGVLSVFTNSWSQARYCPVTNTVTNVCQWTHLDLCHGVDGVPFPAYSNNTRFAQLTGSEPWVRFPSLRAIANAREVLRGTVRLADVDYVATNQVTRFRLYQYDDRPVQTHSVDGEAHYDLDAREDYATEYAVPAYTAMIPSRFDSSLVTTGGVRRVAVEAVYLYATYSFSTPPTNGTAIVRLPSALLVTSGELATVHVPVDLKAVCSTVAEAVGRSAVPAAGVSYRAPQGESRHWEIAAGSYIIIYRITPSVKLPDW